MRLAVFAALAGAVVPGVARAQDAPSDAAPAADSAGGTGAAGGSRQHATAAFTVGAVGPEGFGAGFAGSFGWDLSGRFGIEFAGGVGGMQQRGGGAVGGVFAHGGALLPVTFNVCASVPRVCPALDLDIAVLPGLGYAYLDGLHAGSVILGFSVSSLRKTQAMDVGVHATLLTYLDVLGSALSEDADRLLGLVQLQLGCIIRWGVAQP
jgi:hypothetical protein